MTGAAALCKLLVANRGEIALRIDRACRELGIASVAVVTPDDRGSLHARSADELVEISSYLDAGELVRAARETGAALVHPGYGFLAENADFAEAVAAAGLVFVGPPAEALRCGADKVAARAIAERAGVPLLPAGDPDAVGFPLLVKAAAGGGGRGMRVVRDAGALAGALASARREAEAAFGDGRVYCERFLERPRHVEVQLLGDGEGRLIALGERDCSLQRRHQKLVEEAPAPHLEPALAQRLAAAALAFAGAIGYRNAGTVEFLVAGEEFFFLELNGRIQVEHPVTELVSGVDLVASQIELARGGSLEALHPTCDGHAIEARVYAEHPQSFLPQAGTIERLVLPRGVRVDAGVEEGDPVGVAYDPLLAKVIAHGASRAEALERLSAALGEMRVGGVVTNLPLLRWAVRQPAFRAGAVTTAFLDDHPPFSSPLGEPSSPWDGGFRLNLPRAPRHPPLSAERAEASAEPVDGVGESTVAAPMPGVVLRVLVAPGAHVTARQPLVILSAMKMETAITAPYRARVKAVHVGEGESVTRGALLVELGADGGEEET